MKDEVKERLTKFWNRQKLDRPCIAVVAPSGKKARQIPVPSDCEDIYFDSGYITDCLKAEIESIYYGGEALPSYAGLAAWTIAYGAKVSFSERTIWHEPFIKDINSDISFDLNFDDPWIKKVDKLMLELVKASNNNQDFAVGLPALLPGNDMLSLLRGPNDFLIDLIENPEKTKALIEKLGMNWVQLVRHYEESMGKYQGGYVWGWLGLWAPFPWASFQSDVSCMISPEMYEEFVIPELNIVAKEFGHIFYHLDGPGALVHLPRLCKTKEIDVIQWVPGAGAIPNGPHWIDVYKKIQSAGKAVHISMEAKYIKEVVKELDPSLIYIVTNVRSISEAKDLLEGL